jgi:hypothetical protein
MATTTTDEPQVNDGAVVDPGTETPTAEPVAPGADAAVDAQTDQTPTTDAPEAGDTPQADGEQDINAWLKAKGIDPSSPEAVAKVAEMARNAEKRMHQTTAEASQLKRAITKEQSQAETSIPEHLQNDPFVSQLVKRLDAHDAALGTITVTSEVSAYFNAKPEAAAYEEQMAEIVNNRPEVGQAVREGILSLDDLYAMASASGDALSKAKAEGGKEALTAVADKQQARAISGSATTSETSTPDEMEDAFKKGFWKETAL